MRKSHRTERQSLIGPSDKIPIEAQIAADGEEDALDTPVGVMLQPFREDLAGMGRPTLVESHAMASRRATTHAPHSQSTATGSVAAKFWR